MGWWDTGEGDDVAGDIPADAITVALGKHATRAKRQRRSRPSLPAVLDGLARVLRERGGELLEDPLAAAALRGITAPGVRLAARPALPAQADAKLMAVLGEVLEEISGAYVDALDRKPRVREVLANFAFVLAVDPDDYVAGVKGGLEALVAEYGPRRTRVDDTGRDPDQG
jgi:hypothetical protein